MGFVVADRRNGREGTGGKEREGRGEGGFRVESSINSESESEGHTGTVDKPGIVVLTFSSE